MSVGTLVGMYIPPNKHSIALCASLLGNTERALNVELDVSNGAPEWVELIPAGPSVVGRDGRSWLFDRPQDVVANSMRGMDLPIDWEHSTEKKAPHGDEAPAAAWIKQLEIRNGALWGRLDWTARGRASVTNREYRYLSPVFNFDRATQRIVRFTSAGLTNAPNLQLPALNREEDIPVKFSAAIIAALGLAAEATEDHVLTAINSLKSERDTAMNRAQNTPTLDKFVPRADHDAVTLRATNAEAKLATVQRERIDADIEGVVADALKAGKITPATVDYHKASCRQEGGLDRFREYLKAAPVVGDPTALEGQQPGGAISALNAEQKKVADMFGNSAEDLKKYASAAA